MKMTWTEPGTVQITMNFEDEAIIETALLCLTYREIGRTQSPDSIDLALQARITLKAIKEAKTNARSL